MGESHALGSDESERFCAGAHTTISSATDGEHVPIRDLTEEDWETFAAALEQ